MIHVTEGEFHGTEDARLTRIKHGAVGAQHMATDSAFKVVAEGSFAVHNDGTVNSSYVSIPHGLLFVPTITGYTTGTTVKNGGTTVSNNASVPLPTIVAGSLPTTFPNPIGVEAWCYLFADDNEVFFQLFNTTGVAITISGIFWLTQEPAA